VAIAAGDPSVLTEALDRYAESLFARCQSLLPEAEAAEVVTDTFIIAREKLAGLRDPARLGAWLEAVARNECYRRLTARGQTPGETTGGAVAAALPEGLTGRILKVCTDETATGRADRATVAHLAGQFGHDGFPKPVSIPRQLRPGAGRPGAGGPGRRRQPSRLLIATGAIVVAVALVAAISVIIGSNGSHPSQAAAAAAATSQLADGGANSTGPRVELGASVSASTQVTHTPARKSSRSPSQHKQGDPTPSATQSTPAPSAPAQPSSAPPASSPPATTAAPTTPAAGVLRVSPGSLTITSVNNKPDQGTVTITAAGGPISDLSVSVPQPAGHLLVTPIPGSLGSGKQAQLLVTAWGKHSFTATIILSPGNVVITITVVAAT